MHQGLLVAKQRVVLDRNAVEAAAGGNDDVRNLQCLALIGNAVDLHVPGIGRVVVRKDVLAAIDGHHRGTAGLGEGHQVGRAVLEDDGLASQDQGVARIPNQPGGALDRAGLGRRRGRGRRLEGERRLDLGLGDVARQGDHHGAWPTAAGEFDRARRQARHLVGAFRLQHRLGQRSEGRVRVDFLERFATARLTAYVSHEKQQRCRVLLRRVDPDRGVGGARTA